MWRLGAGRERPRAAVLGGVHGNELSGVEVGQREGGFEPKPDARCFISRKCCWAGSELVLYVA